MIAYTIYADDFELYNAEEGINLGVTSAKLNLEINTPGTFTFSLKLHCDAVKQLKPYLSTVAVKVAYLVYNRDTLKYETLDEYFPFVGRITDMTKDVYGNVDVSCEEAPSFLNDILIPIKSGHHGRTINDILTLIDTNYKLIIQNEKRVVEYDVDDSAGADFAYEGVDEYEEFDIGGDADASVPDEDELTYQKGYDYFIDEILDELSGILYFLYDYSTATGATIKYSYIESINPGLSYVAKRGQMPSYEGILDANELFETIPSFGFGINILDMSEDPVKSEKYSGILPVGDNGLTVGGEENYTWDDILWIESLEEKYGRIVKQVEFSGITKADELMDAASRYITAYGTEYGNRFTINAVEPCEVIEDMNFISRIGHITAVRDVEGDLYIFPMLSISWDLFDIKNNEYVIGPFVPDAIVSERISSSTKKTKKTKTKSSS